MKKTLLILLAMYLSPDISSAIEPASGERIDEVARKGRHVMPFDLDRTLHIFNKNEQGGVQRVIAKDCNDQQQIALIRQHLTKISGQFKHGDFSGPQSIHGAGMPGLSVLQNAEPGAIDIAYRKLPDGAELIYTTAQPKLIEALHQWFDAQLRDHGRHATGHHNMHHQ